MCTCPAATENTAPCCHPPTLTIKIFPPPLWQQGAMSFEKRRWTLRFNTINIKIYFLVLLLESWLKKICIISTLITSLVQSE